MPLTHHLAAADAWSAANPEEPYSPASLAEEGFVHCTDGAGAMAETANRHYADDPRRFVILTLDLDAVGSPWRYDDPGSPYPHVYGPIERRAVVAVDEPIRDRDGRFLAIATPAAAPVADALVRLGLPVRVAPSAIGRLAPGRPVAGAAVPCRHAGSVDVILEAIDRARAGSVLVVDDEGRMDEGCIGDLIVAEARGAGIAGIVVWGAIRDVAELRRIALPVWSLGTLPVGPRSARPDRSDRLVMATIGELSVSADDIVFADDDGVVVVSADEAPRVISLALDISRRESAQATGIGAGRPLRDQLRFGDYLTRRGADPDYDFRRHLAEVGGAIET
jgi:regulator of RNase E activity RraA